MMAMAAPRPTRWRSMGESRWGQRRVLIGGNSDSDVRLVDPYGSPAATRRSTALRAAAVGAAFALRRRSEG